MCKHDRTCIVDLWVKKDAKMSVSECPVTLCFLKNTNGLAYVDILYSVNVIHTLTCFSSLLIMAL